MDDHFSRVLAAPTIRGEPDLVRFIASEVFAGKKPGYYYTKGSKGMGYYYDPAQKEALFLTNSTSASTESKRRKIESESSPALSTISSSNSAVRKDQIDQILEENDENLQQIVPLDVVSLKNLILNLDKKVKKNQMMRIKNAEDPKKFMDSEIEVYEQLQELYSIAAYPELYNVFIENDGLHATLELLSHENADIAIAAIGLLQEMVDSESMEGLDEDVHANYAELVDALIQKQGYDLLIQNLRRLDESTEEGAQGVFNTLSIIESSVSITPELSTSLCKQTNLLSFLVDRLRSKNAFDQNKLYCSEILSTLLQSSEENNHIYMLEYERSSSEGSITSDSDRLSGTIGGVNDGLEELLMVVKPYYKRDAVVAEEKEMVDNVFLCIRSLLQFSYTGKSKFIELEGFDLMIRCVREKYQACDRALKTIEYAIKRNTSACESFLNAGGLKYIFPLFMGRALPFALEKKKATHPDRVQLEECCISIISELCACFSSNMAGGSLESNKESLLRVQSKLWENENEKLDRCFELFVKYSNKVDVVDREIEALQREYDRTKSEEILDLIDEDRVQIRRLENGLESLIHLSIILASVFNVRPDSLRRIALKLEAEGLSVDRIVEVLHEYIAELRQADSDIEESGGGSIADRSVKEYSQALIALHDTLLDLLPDSHIDS